MNEPILSIYVATYNHEKYITQALDSILMQKTDYSYEVLVGEDFSTDNTRAVLKEYEKEHPGKFTIFYRDHNTYRDNPNNIQDLIMRCRGKYIIALEGDDFWTDPNKINRQIDFLETHPEYIAVAHHCTVVGHDSQPNGEIYPECQDEEYSFRHYFSEILPGQLTTVMYRNIFIDSSDKTLFEKKLTPPDRVLYFHLLMHGKIHCIQEPMSAYRHVTAHGSSYSATYRYHFSDFEKLYRVLLQYAKEKKHTEAVRITEGLYFRHLVVGMRCRQCSIARFFQCIKKIDSKGTVFLGYISYLLRKNVFRLKLWI